MRKELLHFPRGVFVAAAIVCVFGTGCGEDTAPLAGWKGQIDTLSGGAVRILNPNEGRWGDEDRWVLEEDLQIGSFDSGGPEMFGQIRHVAVGRDGELFVLEGQAHEIRVFDAQGSYLRTIGREGAGPGELNLSFGGQVFPTVSAIWVNNSGNRRFERFSYEGQPLGSTPNPSGLVGLAPVLGSDGAFYVRDRIDPTSLDGNYAAVLRLEDIDGTLRETDTLRVPTMPDPELMAVSLTRGGSRVKVQLFVPLVHQPTWTYDPSLHFWVNEGTGYRRYAESSDDARSRVDGC